MKRREPVNSSYEKNNKKVGQKGTLGVACLVLACVRDLIGTR